MAPSWVVAQDSMVKEITACHLKIDPQNFALESFDPVGLWWEKYGNG